MSIPNFLAALSGGDLPADAVREERCLKAPIGCGQPLIAEDGTARVFWDEEEASRYEAEWRITGLCPDCQDAIDAAEPITDLATAVEVMGALPMPAGPAAPKPRWQQARTELIRTFRDYMPETAATKATDLLDEVIAEALLEGDGERPSRFNATPSDVDRFLRRILAEDTYLRYQQAVGEQALGEAVEDAQTVRASADNDGLYNADWREGWDDAIQRVDPDHNGPCPSALITFTNEEAGR